MRDYIKGLSQTQIMLWTQTFWTCSETLIWPLSLVKKNYKMANIIEKLLDMFQTTVQASLSRVIPSECAYNNYKYLDD